MPLSFETSARTIVSTHQTSNNSLKQRICAYQSLKQRQGKSSLFSQVPDPIHSSILFTRCLILIYKCSSSQESHDGSFELSLMFLFLLSEDCPDEFFSPAAWKIKLAIKIISANYSSSYPKQPWNFSRI